MSAELIFTLDGDEDWDPDWERRLHAEDLTHIPREGELVLFEGVGVRVVQVVHDPRNASCEFFVRRLSARKGDSDEE